MIKDYSVEIKEFKCLTWEDKLEQVKKYIDLNGKRPTKHSNDESVKKLGRWLNSSLINYKKEIKIMNNKKIRKIWEEFITSNIYGKYFLSNEEEWINTFNITVKYIDYNNKLPSKRDKNESIKKLNAWIILQTSNYKKKLK